MLIEECFEYNQHFVAMMNIINLAKSVNIGGKFERHHIIPKCFYKTKGLKIDNSESNLVNLTYEQHQKVHQLAVLCAKEIVLAQLRYAANMMNNTKECRRLGGHLSEEHKAKICAAKLGDKNPSKRPEVRAKIGATNKIALNRPEVRAKMSASHKDKKQSPDTIAKRSESLKISQNRPEVKAKISAARKDKKHSPETKANMSAAQNRPEVKAKKSAAMKGENNPMYNKHHSHEAKSKMSASHQGKHWHKENGKRVWTD